MATHYQVKTKYTADEIRQIQKYIVMMDIVSLSAPVGDEKENELGEFILDEGPSVQERIEEDDRRDLLLQVVHECLSPREEKVIIELYGLESRERKTLQQVGEMFGVTRERIRQIEGKALRKLGWYLRNKKKIKGMEDI